MEALTRSTFTILFPKYAELTTTGTLATNDSLEYFLKNQLPGRVDMVRKLETTLESFLNQFTNLIIRRPQLSSLSYSLSKKATDMMEQTFRELDRKRLGADKDSIADSYSKLSAANSVEKIRQKVLDLQPLINEKYIQNRYMRREEEEKVAEALYFIFELYHFAKSDMSAYSAKHEILEGSLCYSVLQNQPNIDLSRTLQSTYLQQKFQQYIGSLVQKRCRPFHNKKQTFSVKLREVRRQIETQLDKKILQAKPQAFVQFLLSKQRHRITKKLIPRVQNILKDASDPQDQKSCREITQKVDGLKRRFMGIKNNSFYMDIVRGDFSEKYKMEMSKLENLYYLSNLQKYMQQVMSFVDQLLKIQQDIIQNRKAFRQTWSNKVKQSISQFLNEDSCKQKLTLPDIIDKQFWDLEQLLNSIQVEDQQYSSYNPQTMDYRDDKEERLRKYEEERKRKMEIEAEARARKEEERKVLEANRRAKEKDEEEKRKAKMLQDKQDREKREAEAKRKEEEDRRNRALDMEKRQRDLEEKRKVEEDKKKMEEKQRKQLEDKKRKEMEERRKKEDEQRQKREQQEKRRRQQELKKKKEEEQQRQRREQEKQKRQDQQRKRKLGQMQKLKQQENRRKQAQQKRKREQEDRRRKQAQDRKRRQEEDLKRKQEEDKRRKEEQDRKKKQLEDKKKRDEEQSRRKQEEQLKRKQEQDKRKKEEEERKKKEKEEQKKREDEERVKKEEERKKKEEEDRKKREADEKKRKEEEDRKKKQEQQRKKKEAEEKKRKQEEQKKRKEEQQRKKKQKEEQERRKKQADEKKRKEEEEKKKKEEQQRKKKEAEQKQRKKKEQEAKKKQQQQRLKKQAELKKQKQQEERKKKQQQQKKKKEAELKKKQEEKKKVEPKKSSGFNYGDLDDELIDEDEDIKKPSKGIPSVPDKNKKQDDQYLQEYDDDFDDFSPDKDQKEGQGDEDKEGQSAIQLIGYDDLKCLNDYMKGTSYARKNKPNLETFNNKTQYVYLFEEFTQAGKFFIYNDIGISKAICDFGHELEDENVPQQELQATLETIRQALAEENEKVIGASDTNPETRLIFPLSFENDLGIYLVEISRVENYIIIVFKEEPANTEIYQIKLQNYIQAFRHIYGIEQDLQMVPIVVPPQSKSVLDTFDKQLPNLLLLFVMHYQQDHDLSSPLIINQYTIQRFFYTSHVLQPFYQSIQSQQQKLVTFFSNLHKKYQQNQKLKVFLFQADITSGQYQSDINMAAQQIKNAFLKDNKAKHYFFMMQLVSSDQEEQFRKVVLYGNLSKEDAGKPILTYYIVSVDDQDEEFGCKLYQMASHQIDDKFEVLVYRDFTRHNGLTEYSEWTLGLWAHVVQKRKLSPSQAFRTMTLSMTPYFVAYKQMD